jgi:hypothetical protein
MQLDSAREAHGNELEEMRELLQHNNAAHQQSLAAAQDLQVRPSPADIAV